ncbi:cysteine protease [Brevundimonas sp. VNH65]|uniref:cysteine protease n=1 Tax=Brevundimonas sp. VNH65 TaxID=3400917 RepID=UPI003C01FD1B
MALSRLATVLGGVLLSRSGRRFAGRHAGKLALATLAWELYQQHRSRGTPQAGATQPKATPHPRRRWSGRRT